MLMRSALFWVYHSTLRKIAEQRRYMLATYMCGNSLPNPASTLHSSLSIDTPEWLEFLGAQAALSNYAGHNSPYWWLRHVH
jgi:hypothetical protein